MNSYIRRIGILSFLAVFLFFGLTASAQKVETVDGVRVVHNSSDGKWGKTPPVSLQPIRVIGDVDTDDENVAFNMPSDLDVDAQGRLYVMDMGNHRIQVFGPDGKFLKTIGRRGQGPGEFFMPSSIALDAAGNLYVVESNTGRIQTFAPDGKIVKTMKLPELGIGNAHILSSGHILSTAGGVGLRIVRMSGGGAEQKEGMPALIKVIDGDGKLVREFGRGTDFKDMIVNDMANTVIPSVDAADNVCVVFPYQNRVEKYTADGRLLWRADRTLSYSMEIKGKGNVKTEGSGGQTSATIRMPEMNRCATGAAMDAKGRLWVVTMARQLRENEKVQTSMTMSNVNGAETWGQKTTGAVDLRTTDAYKLEVFDPEGVLLGAIPVGIFVDGIFIRGDRLFLVDKSRGVQIHEFKIKE